MNPFALSNILFLLGLAAGIFFMAVTAVSGIGDGHDADADHDADIDHGHDALVGRALSLLGVGRMPLLLLLTVLSLLFGAIGFLLNVVFSRSGLPPYIYGWLSFIAASVSSIALTRAVARVFAKIMPKTESYGTTNEELCGCQGVAVYSVTETDGMVQVRDWRGGLQKVAARTKDGEKIPMNGAVEILSYRENDNCFIVTTVVSNTRPC